MGGLGRVLDAVWRKLLPGLGRVRLLLLGRLLDVLGGHHAPPTTDPSPKTPPGCFSTALVGGGASPHSRFPSATSRSSATASAVISFWTSSFSTSDPAYWARSLAIASSWPPM